LKVIRVKKANNRKNGSTFSDHLNNPVEIL
jgi:hypothetical protein